jgi:hypothetical protein
MSSISPRTVSLTLAILVTASALPAAAPRRQERPRTGQMSPSAPAQIGPRTCGVRRRRWSASRA